MIDAVIPAHAKDVDTLDLCINGIKNNVIGIRNVYVVSREELTKNAIWIPESTFPFTLKEVGDLIGNHWRTCWYYAGLIQQTSAVVIPNLANNVLISDCDTVFIKPVHLVDPEGRSVFNVSYDVPGDVTFHPYFEYMEKLIPGLTKQTKFSGIVHHMPVQKDILEELIERAEKTHGKPFWEANIGVTLEDFKSVNTNSHRDGQGMMSTYDLYFNYVYKYHPNKMVIRPLKSILAYKGCLGVKGLIETTAKSRTNLYGDVQILDPAEEKDFNFDTAKEAMEHITVRCRQLGWDAVTFQNHTRTGVDAHKQINAEYINNVNC
tara:strand:- start:110 stop:1069 length:960 start_codon:yes stop_codon:yes gene_type:complete